MNEKRKKIEDIISDIDKAIERLDSLKYALDTPMFWEEYLDYLKDCGLPDDYIRAINKVREVIEKNNLYGMTGREYQYSEWYEKIKKEAGVTLSMRSWGKLMASLMNTREGKRKYVYTDFAWI